MRKNCWWAAIRRPTFFHWTERSSSALSPSSPSILDTHTKMSARFYDQYSILFGSTTVRCCRLSCKRLIIKKIYWCLLHGTGEKRTRDEKCDKKENFYATVADNVASNYVFWNKTKTIVSKHFSNGTKQKKVNRKMSTAARIWKMRRGNKRNAHSLSELIEQSWPSVRLPLDLFDLNSISNDEIFSETSVFQLTYFVRFV